MEKDLRDKDLILEELQNDEKKIQLEEKKIKISFAAIAFLIAVIGIGFFYTLVRLNKVSQSEKTVSKPTAKVLNSPSPETTETPSPTPIVLMTQVAKDTLVKDQFIPFGSGSDQSTDWADVPGLEANIDFGNYPNIKNVYFEISVSIPTANETASVRLYNKTDNHPVWYSEVSTENGVYAVSQPIIYDKGVKTYQVQMKTQLGYLANLTLVRIHIILR